MQKSTPGFFSDYDVRVRAYLIWEREGRPEGQAELNWLRAIAELKAESGSVNGGDAPDHVPARPDVSEPPSRSVADTINAPAKTNGQG